MAIPELSELVLDQAEHALTPAKNVLVVGDLGDQILMLEPNLVGLESGETRSCICRMASAWMSEAMICSCCRAVAVSGAARIRAMIGSS